MSQPTTTRRVGSLLDPVVAPTRALLGRLRLAPKFGLIALVSFAPLAYAVVQYTDAQGASANFTHQEQAGMSYVAPAYTLVERLVEARSAAVSGDAVAADAVREAVTSVGAIDATIGSSLATTEAWTSLDSAISNALGASPEDASAAYALWTPVVDASVALVSTAADGSNLTLDPDLNSFYLMDAATTKTPTLFAAAGAAHDLALLPESAEITADLTVAHVRIDDAVSAIQAGFDKSIGALSDQAAITELTDAKASLAEAADSGDPARLGDATSTVAETARRNLGKLLQIRVDGITGNADTTLYISIAGFVLALWLFVGFYQSVKRGLDRVNVVLQAAAKGDLTVRVTDISREEIGAMSAALNSALDNMSETLTTVNARTVAVVGSATALNEVGGLLQADSARAVFHADSVASLARDLRGDTDRTLMEVTSVKEVLSEVTFATGQLDEDMQAVSAASVQLNSAVREVARVAEETQRRAADAVDKVGEARLVVGGLANAAEEIGGIVELIEDIAEQTNLLALNATVEAARAGEAGRSFAVVAAEVKNLATATTAATERIRDSILAVQQGSGNAAAAISQIVSVIDGISEGQITVAAAVEEEIAMAVEIERSVTRQTTGVADIRISISSINASLDGVKQAAENVSATAQRAASAGSEMAETARNNVGSANRTGGAADELAGTAAALQAAVGRFTIDGGAPSGAGRRPSPASSSPAPLATSGSHQ